MTVQVQVPIKVVHTNWIKIKQYANNLFNNLAAKKKEEEDTHIDINWVHKYKKNQMRHN